jgi:hypothetical protein
LRSPVVLVGVRFHFVLVDYSDDYEMMFNGKQISGNLTHSLIWMNQYAMKTRCASLMEDSVEAAVTMHLYAILSMWNFTTEICERDSCIQVPLNLRV